LTCRIFSPFFNRMVRQCKMCDPIFGVIRSNIVNDGSAKAYYRDKWDCRDFTTAFCVLHDRFREVWNPAACIFWARKMIGFYGVDLCKWAWWYNELSVDPDVAMRRVGGFRTSAYAISEGGLAGLPNGNLATVQWFPDRSWAYGHCQVAEVDGRSGDGRALAILVSLREGMLSDIAVSNSSSMAAMLQTRERRGERGEHAVHVFDMRSQPWSLLRALDAWPGLGYVRSMTFWNDTLVMSDGVEEQVHILDFRNGDRPTTLVIGDHRNLDDTAWTGAALWVDVAVWHNGLLYFFGYGETGEEALLYRPTMDGNVVHTGISALPSDGTYLHRLCAVPGVGILVETRHEDSIEGKCVLKLFAPPDDIAMASMSERRVEWMTAVVRMQNSVQNVPSAKPQFNSYRPRKCSRGIAPAGCDLQKRVTPLGGGAGVIGVKWMQGIDAGVNLVGPAFPDPDVAVVRALEHGVTRLLCISNTIHHWESAVSVCRRFPGHVFCTIGVHPQDVKALVKERIMDKFELRLSEAVAASAECVAVGECGLDCPSPLSRPKRAQVDAFRTQARVAKAMGKAMYLHSRNAHVHFLEVLRQVNYFRGVVHCFTGSAAEAAELVGHGLCIGVSGLLMNPARNTELEAALRDGVVPLNKVLIETDAPWMSVDPARGSEPRDVHVLYNRVAELRGVPVEEVYTAVTANFLALFGLESL
jgi:TatD DNase family protein